MSTSRRSEIEAKRARIAEMRRAREALQQEEKRRTPPTKEDIDQLVDSLVTTKISDAPKGSFDVFISDAFEQAPAVVAQTKATTATSTTPLVPPKISYSKGVQTDSIEEQDIDVGYQEAPGIQPPTSDTQSLEVVIDKSEAHVEVVFADSSTVVPEDVVPFVQQSIKVVERALYKPQSFDILTDYGGSTVEAATAALDETMVSQSLQFDHPDTNDRAVLDLAWSHVFPELLVASYTQKRDTISTEAKGCVKVWNTHMPQKPEYTFVADSDVTSVLCSPFHPTLIFGGLYNGQVMIWDMRAKTAGGQAILASPLSGSSGHSHPIFSLDLFGSQNASSLVSASTDGTICTWSPDILAKPQDQIELRSLTDAHRNLVISPTALVTSTQDTSFFLVGSEEGSLYHCNRYDKAGASAGIDQRISTQYSSAHLAPVTSLDLHPSKHNVDLGHYLLSSGFDWKIKLWRASSSSDSSSPLLHTIYRDDTVYCSKWHPTCPSLFGAVDGSGHFEIYDLLTDIDVPVVRVKPQTKTPASADTLSHPLNKLAWDKTGQCASVGGFDGVVTVFDLGSDLLSKNSIAEWKDVNLLLNKIDS